MSFLPRAGMSALKVPPILNCGIRSSRMFRTTCASLITTRLMIGVPGATSSPRLGEDSGYLSVFGSSEPGVYKKGGNFIHRAACGIYKATCGCAVFAFARRPQPFDIAGMPRVRQLVQLCTWLLLRPFVAK